MNNNDILLLAKPQPVDWRSGKPLTVDTGKPVSETPITVNPPTG